jgi:hypothetical protein
MRSTTGLDSAVGARRNSMESVAEGLGYEMLLFLSELSEVISCFTFSIPQSCPRGYECMESKEGSQGHESSAITDVIVKLAKLSI